MHVRNELDCSKLMFGGSRRDGWGTIGGPRPPSPPPPPSLATRLLCKPANTPSFARQLFNPDHELLITDDVCEQSDLVAMDSEVSDDSV